MSVLRTACTDNLAARMLRRYDTEALPQLTRSTFRSVYTNNLQETYLRDGLFAVRTAGWLTGQGITHGHPTILTISPMELSSPACSNIVVQRHLI